MGASTDGVVSPSQYMRRITSCRLSAGGGGAIVTQMWVMTPAPFTSKMSRRAPLAIFEMLSPLPPVLS
jgi:hypothetical protein